MAAAGPEVVNARRIGFLADTHCRQPDGSDLPQQALDAFAGCDLIVHLGDIGKAGVIDRLGTIARVLTPTRGKAMVVDAGGVRVGMTFDLTKLGVEVRVDEQGVDLLGRAPAEVVERQFGGPVDVVAFGGTHRALRQEQDGIVFLNPGSPTLPADRQGEDDLGSVAVLDLAGGKASVQIVRLSKA